MEPNGTCMILDAVDDDEEKGSNGGCHRSARFWCAECGSIICEWHAWSHDGHILCAVCYGITGYQVPDWPKDEDPGLPGYRF